MLGQPKPKLTSWKEIAAFLARDVRTVQRWERGNHLPVHRVPGGRGYSVYAYPEELAEWLAQGPAPAETPKLVDKLADGTRPSRPGATPERSWSMAWRRIRPGALAAVTVVLAVIALLAGARLLPRHGSPSSSAAGSTSPASSLAYAEYLLGREAWNLRTKESLHCAVAHFGRAVEKDPDNALAYSGLADSYLLLAFYNEPTSEVIPKAYLAAMHALSLDPKRAEARTSLAAIKVLNWDWSDAEQEFQRAIELGPRYATAHHWYGMLFCAPLGRSPQAVAELKRALELDPDSLIIRTDLGFAQYLAGETDQAIEYYREVLRRDPTFIPAHFRLREAYEKRGNYREAVEEYLRDYQIPSSSPQAVEYERVFREGGYGGFLRKVLQDVAHDVAHVPSLALAGLYGKLGENEHAIIWLEKAYQEREAGLIYLRVSPGFAALRDDPGFVRLERMIGLLDRAQEQRIH